MTAVVQYSFSGGGSCSRAAFTVVVAAQVREFCSLDLRQHQEKSEYGKKFRFHISKL
ncbi:MAG: hypothetical protein J0M29_04040 [Chitinophagales bacterium]|nr:hypothetical protein [Chitinophagales bacterium]